MQRMESSSSVVAAGLARAGGFAARLFVKPELTVQERARQLRSDAARRGSRLDTHNADYRAQAFAQQEHKAWYRRLRKRAVIPALATIVIGTSVSIGETVNAAPASSTAFSAADRTLITSTFARTENFWRKQGVALTTPLVLLENNQTYRCPEGMVGNTLTFAINTASDDSEFCPDTNTVIITASSFNNWRANVGAKTAAELEDDHEEGHAIAALENLQLDGASDTDATQAQERLATCFAGIAVRALDPADISTLYNGLLQDALPDNVHGSAAGQAFAFKSGANDNDCSLAEFYWPGGAQPPLDR